MQIPRCTSLYAAMQLAGWHMSTKSYGNLGVYIQGINGVPQSAGAYWQWYSWTGRSWSLGPVGASSYTLNSDDMILWYLASSNAGPPPPP